MASKTPRPAKAAPRPLAFGPGPCAAALPANPRSGRMPVHALPRSAHERPTTQAGCRNSPTGDRAAALRPVTGF